MLRTVTLILLTLACAFAGLAGSLYVAGPVGALDPRSLDLGLGFTGIIVAALARLNPVAVIPVGILMGALNNAGPALQSIRVPAATVAMLQGPQTSMRAFSLRPWQGDIFLELCSCHPHLCRGG